MTSGPKTKRELKPEQAAAAYTIDRHISVTAGPGAGKTTVLVERYLEILRQNQGIPIEQIVAITFTNRAANQMREQLRTKLDELLQETTSEERQRWMRYKRTLDGAVITTIHGFCSRLLREFPVESQLDPQFTLLDEHRAAMLLEAAVEESLTEFINREDEPVSRLTAGIGRAQLAAALVRLYKTIRGQGLRPDQLEQETTASHATWDQYRALFKTLDARMADLISFRQLSDRAEEKRCEAERQWPHLRELLLKSELPLADYCGHIAEFRAAARPDARGNIANIVSQLDELFWSDDKETPFGRIPQMRFDLDAKDYACEVIRLLQNIDRRFTDSKQQLSALDFDDLQLRALQLLDHREVILRASRRYKFFLVDEFQDTNSLQRDLMNRLALESGERSNLFIVGDRKQSIYGFRGADVDVFREMTEALIKAQGAEKPLRLNFRSQPPLIHFFNFMFARLFKLAEELDMDDLRRLGYVKHEPSEADRESRDAPPLVELMIDTIASPDEDPKALRTPRERDAKQLAQRIISLVEPRTAGVLSAVGESRQDARAPSYRNIALLFRAMTGVPVYEAEFRRAGIPYQTVLGKGFYEREEITDLIQLLRFLDNRTDELALAAVLRSPLCGISDNTLLALRRAPRVGEKQPGAPPALRRRPRGLFKAVCQQREIDFITTDERAALERAAEFLATMIEHRNRYRIADLLRCAVERSEYATVIAATFDGAQRLANVQKLFSLAERFERSGAHLIRDFVQYVHDFEAIGSRESEGQFDDSADTVKLMTIHQAKGLEWPVVIIPDLHRSGGSWDEWFILDRHRGLTLKVPNGRGRMVAGYTRQLFSERAARREQFESMRLLYVAATRAEDRLILSGAIRAWAELEAKRDSWLNWIWRALELGGRARGGIVSLDKHAQLQLTVNLIDEQPEEAGAASGSDAASVTIDVDQPPQKLFPLLRSLEPERERVVHRFSVTQLVNYQRCRRQYYFDRVMHVPAADAIAVWNDAEAPEPPANLTATLKGAVIHRFCETFAAGDDPRVRLRSSFGDVTRKRWAEFAERLSEIDPDKAIKELLPLAEKYLASSVFQRVEAARGLTTGVTVGGPGNEGGLWSELSFRLRRPLGILTGTIDKLLITPSSTEDGFDVEIIDFKTNRLGALKWGSPAGESQSKGGEIIAGVTEPEMRARRPRSQDTGAAQQIAFDFSSPTAAPAPLPILEQVKLVASDYQLQLQAYALAVRELLPSLFNKGGNISVTLHFLDPNVEFHLAAELLEPDICAHSIDSAMIEIPSSLEPEHFTVRPAFHCRSCNFLDLCAAGQQWLHGAGRSA